MSTPAERIRDALKSVCSSIPAGRSLRASADAALAALAELERDRDELRAKLTQERERQEPILWWDGDKIVSENRKYLFPFVNPPQPLYAHPLDLREPTEDECREIWRAIRRTTATDQISGGRAMWQAVREVMTK